MELLGSQILQLCCRSSYQKPANKSGSKCPSNLLTVSLLFCLACMVNLPWSNSGDILWTRNTCGSARPPSTVCGLLLHLTKNDEYWNTFWDVSVSAGSIAMQRQPYSSPEWHYSGLKCHSYATEAHTKNPVNKSEPKCPSDLPVAFRHYSLGYVRVYPDRTGATWHKQRTPTAVHGRTVPFAGIELQFCTIGKRFRKKVIRLLMYPLRRLVGECDTAVGGLMWY